MEVRNINIVIRKILSKCINYSDIVNGKDEDCNNSKTIELYNYLISEEDPHPSNMHLYIYSTILKPNAPKRAGTTISKAGDNTGF